MTVVAMIYVLTMMDRINNKMEKAQQERINHLAAVIDHVGDDSESTKEMKAIYNETIYYKGYAYHFNDNGFVSKDEITDLDVLEKSESTIIKVVENDTTKIVSEVVVSTTDKVSKTSKKRKKEVQETSKEIIENEKGEENA